MLDGGAPYYTTYETSDGRYVSLGPIEPKFFALLCRKIELPQDLWNAQNDRARWPELREAMAGAFQRRTMAQWSEMLEGTDVCFAPVLTLQEAVTHPHIAARHGFTEIDGVLHTAPAPRFSSTPSAIQSPPGGAPVSVDALLAQWQCRP
jgi:alpha-methylacyl-CoA racemase